jgi:hypothetical protein
MNRAYLWLSLPIVYILVVWGALQQAPDFVTVQFTWVWFGMVVVVMTASLGLLAEGLELIKPKEGKAGEAKGTKPAKPSE